MLTDFLRVLTTMMREIKFLKGCHSSSLSGVCLSSLCVGSGSRVCPVRG